MSVGVIKIDFWNGYIQASKTAVHLTVLMFGVYAARRRTI